MICGTTNPTNAIFPASATALPVKMMTESIAMILMVFFFCPRLLEMSSPNDTAVTFLLREMAIIMPIRKNGAASSGNPDSFDEVWHCTRN